MELWRRIIFSSATGVTRASDAPMLILNAVVVTVCVLRSMVLMIGVVVCYANAVAGSGGER